MVKNLSVRKKLSPFVLIGLGALLLVGSFFIYKYTYIFVERKKYDKATVAIQKVADDLRAQGIETEFSRGCGRTQVVYTNGTLFCNIILEIRNKNPEEQVYSSVTQSLVSNNFSLLSLNGVSVSKSEPRSGIVTYSFNPNDLSCGLRYTQDNEDIYYLNFSCGQKTSFKLF